LVAGAGVVGVVGVVAGVFAGVPEPVDVLPSDGAGSLLVGVFLVGVFVLVVAESAPFTSSAAVPSGIAGAAQATATKQRASASPRRLFE
jgi:hypothetical protein